MLLAWLLTALLGAAAQAQPAAVQRLTQAEWVYADGPASPQGGWQPMVVPDGFDKTPPEAARMVWVRFAFDLAAPPDGPLVLLVQRVVTTAEFRVNGSLLNPGVRFGTPGGTPGGAAGTQMTNWPHWMVLPQGLLRAGHNELLVRLAGDGLVGPWISGVAVGPAHALRGEFMLRDVPQRLVPQALFVLMLASLPFGLRLWWRERHPLQRHLVLTIVLWLAQVGLYLFPDLPLRQSNVAALSVVLWAAFHWALLSLLWRLAGRPWPWFPRVLAVGSVVPLGLALVVISTSQRPDLLAALMLPATLLRVLTSAMLVQWAWRERSAGALLLTGAELLWLGEPVQTMLVVLDVLPPDPFMLWPGSALPLFLVMLGLATQHLVRQREAAAAEREAAVLGERQRMMLDMHDGIGAQLVTAVRLARREDVPRAEVAALVQEALHDLRLIIDSLDPGTHELQPLLGLLRDRTELRLRAIGQRLDWQIGELPAPRLLSPAAALDVLRIVQEALNNAMRHAGSAATLCVSLRARSGGCELAISDDGTGIGTGADAGRGLASMRRRAERIGVRLEILPGAGHGTVVSLWLPDAAGAR